ncbi:DUF4295 family protein [Blattabacterium cuenoti]|uniref:DUF4295 family protein n=1 Tax=Blattabacterium cuenoti TaxID=1653831 RepID=UPI00163CDB7D|nr:DUF4295 family protein [Blattabacterium cuenoti]
MSKKIEEKNNKNKKVLKKMTLAIKIVKSKKTGFYTFVNRMISNEKVKYFFKK